MSRFYFILDDGQPQDGEFYTRKEDLYRALQYADPKVKVFEMFLDENSVKDVTEDMVREGYENGSLSREDEIVSEYVDLPMTREDYLANEADNAWKMRGEPA